MQKKSAKDLLIGQRHQNKIKRQKERNCLSESKRKKKTAANSKFKRMGDLDIDRLAATII